MKRRRTAIPRRVADAVGALRNALEAADLPYMLIGGVAVVSHGIARTTRDVDATVPGASLPTEALLERLAEHGIAARIPDAAEFSRASQVLLLRHEGGVDVDLTFAWLDFELEALRAATDVRIGRQRVRVARPEDLVVYKLVGGRPVDLADIDELLALHGGVIDVDRLRAHARWVAEALDDPERVEVLEAALRRSVRR